LITSKRRLLEIYSENFTDEFTENHDIFLKKIDCKKFSPKYFKILNDIENRRPPGSDDLRNISKIFPNKKLTSSKKINTIKIK